MKETRFLLSATLLLLIALLVSLYVSAIHSQFQLNLNICICSSIPQWHCASAIQHIHAYFTANVFSKIYTLFVFIIAFSTAIIAIYHEVLSMLASHVWLILQVCLLVFVFVCAMQICLWFCFLCCYWQIIPLTLSNLGLQSAIINLSESNCLNDSSSFEIYSRLANTQFLFILWQFSVRFFFLKL